MKLPGWNNKDFSLGRAMTTAQQRQYVPQHQVRSQRFIPELTSDQVLNAGMSEARAYQQIGNSIAQAAEAIGKAKANAEYDAAAAEYLRWSSEDAASYSQGAFSEKQFNVVTGKEETVYPWQFQDTEYKRKSEERRKEIEDSLQTKEAKAQFRKYAAQQDVRVLDELRKDKLGKEITYTEVKTQEGMAQAYSHGQIDEVAQKAIRGKVDAGKVYKWQADAHDRVTTTALVDRINKLSVMSFGMTDGQVESAMNEIAGDIQAARYGVVDESGEVLTPAISESGFIKSSDALTQFTVKYYGQVKENRQRMVGATMTMQWLQADPAGKLKVEQRLMQDPDAVGGMFGEIFSLVKAGKLEGTSNLAFTNQMDRDLLDVRLGRKALKDVEGSLVAGLERGDVGQTDLTRYIGGIITAAGEQRQARMSAGHKILEAAIIGAGMEQAVKMGGSAADRVSDQAKSDWTAAVGRYAALTIDQKADPLAVAVQILQEMPVPVGISVDMNGKATTNVFEIDVARAELVMQDMALKKYPVQMVNDADQNRIGRERMLNRYRDDLNRVKTLQQVYRDITR